jgi:putative two-component system response regulator
MSDRILVVDDNQTNHTVAEEMLEDRYEVSCVSSGKEALDYLNDHVPDLILLNLHLPDISGLDLFQKLKEKESVKRVPVIFLTADCNPENEAAILKAGAMDFIRKPLIAEVLQCRIGRILELYHFQQSLQTEVERKTAELQRINRKVKNLSVQVMTTLANTIDAKNKYTKGHSVRVAQYAQEIARRMGKTEQEIEDIYRIGLLHDIGKIGIPDAIINKPAMLTEEENEVIRNHSQIGAEILKDMTEIPDAAVGAHWHHERFDGLGYPDGLKGYEIPESARIIGVADAYDAMASRRCYRDVLPQAEVRAEIEQGRGSQFDPAIADVMLQMIDEDTSYSMREMK